MGSAETESPRPTKRRFFWYGEIQGFCNARRTEDGTPSGPAQRGSPLRSHRIIAQSLSKLKNKKNNVGLSVGPSA